MNLKVTKLLDKTSKKIPAIIFSHDILEMTHKAQTMKGKKKNFMKLMPFVYKAPLRERKPTEMGEIFENHMNDNL